MYYAPICPRWKFVFETSSKLICSDKCKKQPEEEDLYLPNGLSSDKIAGVLKSENLREAIRGFLQSKANLR